jgi:hypothetical protein
MRLSGFLTIGGRKYLLIVLKISLTFEDPPEHYAKQLATALFFPL